MLLGKKAGFVFIHIPKTGGMSVKRALEKKVSGPLVLRAVHLCRRFGLNPPFGPYPPGYHYHAKAKDIAAVMGQQTFDRLFSFAFVRNPYSWQVSSYNYMLKTDRRRTRAFMRELGSFEKYLEWRCTRGRKLQKDHVCDNHGRIMISFVGHYERFELDFQEACRRMGLGPMELPWLNRSNQDAYEHYYTERTRRMVRETFAEDFALFGYEP